MLWASSQPHIEDAEFAISAPLANTRTALTASRTATSSVTSADRAIAADWPRDLISSATLPPADPSRANRHTAYPSPARARAVIVPMPREAPVTTATLPGKTSDNGSGSDSADSGTRDLRLPAGARPRRQRLSQSPGLENR